jgi:hypothetical protein
MAAEQIDGARLGDFYSYNLSVETKINIDELIYILSPMDLPLTTGVGSDGAPVLSRQPVDNFQFFWLEEEILLPRATLAGVLAADTGTTVTVGAGEAAKFRVGDSIRIDDEVMLVTDIDITANTLTVTRGSAAVTGTTQAAHAVGAEVIGTGTVLREGDIAGANYQGRDRYSNYTQIFSGRIEVSRTEQRIPKYGVPNELNKQIVNVMHGTKLSIEQAALYQIKHYIAADGSRQTGGLDSFLVSNVNTSDDHLTVEGIQGMQQEAYDEGGMFTHLMSRPGNFVALNNVAGAERVQTVTVEDARRGRRRATSVMTEFGDVMLVRNRWCRATDAFAYSADNFVQRDFQPMILQPLAKTRDTDSFMIVAELGFEVKGESHCAKWTSLDSTAAMPTAGLV